MSTPSGTWVVPPPFGKVGDYSDLPSYGMKSTQTINWTTTEQDTQIWLLHDGDAWTCEELNLGLTWCATLLTGNRGSSWNWPILQPANYSSSAPVYYLQMRSSSLASLFTSHYFNILPQNLLPQSSSTSTSSASSSTTSSSAMNIPPSSTPASTSPTSMSTTTNTNLSSGNKTAIGVAIGVGVPLIALLAIIVYLLHRRDKKKYPDQNSDRSDSHKKPPLYQDAHAQPQQHPQLISHEMSGTNYASSSYKGSPSELSGNPYSTR